MVNFTIKFVTVLLLLFIFICILFLFLFSVLNIYYSFFFLFWYCFFFIYKCGLWCCEVLVLCNVQRNIGSVRIGLDWKTERNYFIYIAFAFLNSIQFRTYCTALHCTVRFIFIFITLLCFISHLSYFVHLSVLIVFHHDLAVAVGTTTTTVTTRMVQEEEKQQHQQH